MTQQAQQAPPRRPSPVPQPESDFYWQKCKEHELWVRRCKECQRTYFYPRDICPNCFSRNTEWSKTSGKGKLYSYAIAHRAPMPAFQAMTPYVIALVELEGGARMPTNLIGVEPDPAKIRCDMPVEVVFEDVDEKISLPKFRPAS
ncbi:MAG: Zn-ribbon domain-containing OB-fold protein [Chloroflexi bacterium]|nr:Zn-ribbon domain-containing OB-fold protein [Chloroflexota bacterium]